jgi:hypothetical protein
MQRVFRRIWGMRGWVIGAECLMPDGGVWGWRAAEGQVMGECLMPDGWNTSTRHWLAGCYASGIGVRRAGGGEEVVSAGVYGKALDGAVAYADGGRMRYLTGSCGVILHGGFGGLKSAPMRSGLSRWVGESRKGGVGGGVGGRFVVCSAGGGGSGCKALMRGSAACLQIGCKRGGIRVFGGCFKSVNIYTSSASESRPSGNLF